MSGNVRILPMSTFDHSNLNIILVGPMGAGKTTVGKHVARLLGKSFYDVDQELEKRTGVSVNLIFDIEKEQGFRLRETQMLQDLLKERNAVIATGGGIVVTEENRKILQATPHLVVYLKTEVKHQLQRLKRDKQRPLLQGTGRRERLLNMARMRNPMYESVAKLSFTSGRTNPHKMATKIVSHVLAQEHEESNK